VPIEEMNMNQYQKVGIFAARIIGIGMAFYGAMLLISVALLLVSVPMPGQARVFWMMPFIWIAIGVVLVKKASRIGEFLGMGLN
jgi:hypothetical protein